MQIKTDVYYKCLCHIDLSKSLVHGPHLVKAMSLPPPRREVVVEDSPYVGERSLWLQVDQLRKEIHPLPIADTLSYVILWLPSMLPIACQSLDPIKEQRNEDASVLMRRPHTADECHRHRHLVHL